MHFYYVLSIVLGSFTYIFSLKYNGILYIVTVKKKMKQSLSGHHRNTEIAFIHLFHGLYKNERKKGTD